MILGHAGTHTGGYKNGSTGGQSSLFEKQLGLGGVKDPRQHKARPAMLLDEVGDKLMNLWYIPHFTEVGGVCSGLVNLECDVHMTFAVQYREKWGNIYM